MPDTMNAIRLHRYGAPHVLTHEGVPKPQPAADEILIRVHAAAVNPIDAKTRSGGGLAARYGQEQLPLILGWDVSGEVVETGADVRDVAVGDAVFGMICFPDVGATYAEYATAPATHLAPKPATLTHVQAAALPLVTLTAWQALFDAAELTAGQTVLIHAAAGGVGHVAAQLAKWKDAHVIGTASARNADFLRELGVDTFVDYQTTNFEEVVQNVDVVLDSIGGVTRELSWGVLKAGGVLVSIVGEPSAAEAAAYGVRARRVLVQPDGAQMAHIAQLAENGHLAPTIDTVYPLADAADAHEQIERGHTRGKIVLQIVGSD